jgi:hypothetical protein
MPDHSLLKGTAVMKNDKRCVLCVGYSDGGILFIGGLDARLPSITSDVSHAAVFFSPEEALSFHQILPHQLDGAR